MHVPVALEQLAPVMRERSPVRCRSFSARRPRGAPCSAPGRTSSIGVTRSRLPTMSKSPSIVPHSFVSARRLSFECMNRPTSDWRLSSCLPDARVPTGFRSTGHRGARTRRRNVAQLREARHRFPVFPHRRRHGRAARRAPEPRSRPPTAMLAASRLRSHSNGPGSVSSKSLRLKTSLRSARRRCRSW